MRYDGTGYVEGAIRTPICATLNKAMGKSNIRLLAVRVHAKVILIFTWENKICSGYPKQRPNTGC
jgi:hypothetical protein